MKKISLIPVMLLATAVAMAQPQPQRHAAPGGKGKPLTAQRKFQIFATNGSVESIKQTNRDIERQQRQMADSLQSPEKSRFLGTALTALYSAFTQRTVEATQKVVGQGVSALSTTFSNKRKMWHDAARRQCSYRKVLKEETLTSDFYALPSTNGAMDPENLKFAGFGCRNYIELADSAGQGVDVFYVYCKMRRDPVGVNHIVNHSKFLVEVDTLMFVPKYCNLPNDSTGNSDTRFDYDTRRDLTFTLKARIYSSWMNQAVMIAQDQLLGEFSITARIEKDRLDNNGRFVYSAKDSAQYRGLISVDGDCFIVPRSYTGTLDGSTSQRRCWGTGQYRVEMEVAESCDIDDNYYLTTLSPDKKKWNSSKWRPEWRAMKKNSPKDRFLNKAWQCVVPVYRGEGWIATLTDPLATSLYKHETSLLNGLFSLPTASSQAAAMQKAAAAQAAAAAGAMPAGNAATPALANPKPLQPQGK